MELVVGNTYKFAGYDWTCAEAIDGGYCLQSQGVTADTWNNLFNSAATNQDGVDCHTRNSVLNDLYSKIKSAEKTASYGSGLFLVSNAKCGTTTTGTQGSGNYWTALKMSNTNYRSFGANSGCSWLGTVNGSNVWYIGSIGTVDNNANKDYLFVVAPAFNIDSTKAKLVGNEIVIPNTIKVMPEGALYWYGNECFDVTGGLSATGYSRTYVVSLSCYDADKYTNYCHFERPNSSYALLGTQKIIDLSKYTKLNFEAELLSTSTSTNAEILITPNKIFANLTDKANLPLNKGYSRQKYEIMLDSYKSNYYVSYTGTDVTKSNLYAMWLE